jgi:MoaA/NifB/PqqE/SkfB family radical SAM enzyme
MNLSVLYRGPLSSCNYACDYCPFSKRRETKARLERDHAALLRFQAWVADQTQHCWRVLFTPWGEALVRRWYREALVELSHRPHVELLTVQTNLSSGLEWLARCATDRVSLWATYHPTQTSIDRFLRKVDTVRERGVRICVGVVGVPEALPRIEELKQRLPDGVYLWVNAQQPRRRPYTPEEHARLQAVDSQFPMTTRRQPSFGGFCSTGESSFTVDGDGHMRRCHFVDEVIGNVYQPGWEDTLHPRTCPRRFCDCFLGKSQLLGNQLTPFFGAAVMARLRDVPAGDSPYMDCR